MRLKINVRFKINKFDPALVGYFRFSELAKRGEAGRQEIEAEKEALESVPKITTQIFEKNKAKWHR